VLARTLESEGLTTILTTMMPYWAQRIGAPRTLGVEFPFGHTLGGPHNAAQQMRVIREALTVLETATRPGEIVYSEEKWPVPTQQAIKDWQPEEPSPIIRELAPRIRDLIRQRRSSGA